MTSTHLTRDRRSNDPLEPLLEDWGHWRAKRLSGSDLPGVSPIAAVNQLEKGFTNSLDQRRTIEDRRRIQTLKIPKETRNVKPVILKYSGHKFWSRIDQILATTNQRYYKILINIYENEWQKADFIKLWNWNEEVAWKQIQRARKAAKKVLKENGLKV